MKILALEFSSARRGVAVVEDDHVPGLAEGDGLTPGPFELIEAALRAAGCERGQIECIVVGLGPGSYTGVRSAIALAQGWQLALGVKLLGTSSAEVLAATAQAAGLTGRIAVVIDALRGEFYSASYEIAADGWRETAPLRLLTREAVEALAASGEALVSPDAKCPFAGATKLQPSARELGRLAAGRSDFQPGEKIEPIYLRETSFVKAPPPRHY
ncbi:MAG: tRNA (adenosine(37)-N6)-threonylcarbamoyltransferase complex dimerization subunit type 1 TsaB [Limisphaerales bacterium]